MVQEKMVGKVALVTGGTSGLGFQAAQRLLGEGAVVYITGLDHQALSKAAARLGGKVHAVRADSGVKEDMETLAAAIGQAHGRLDFVLVNAGRLVHITPLGGLAEEEIDATLHTNFKGVILTVQSVLPVLQSGASVVLMSSVTADMGLPGSAQYAGTKAAIRAFVKVWTSEFKDRNIRFNSVTPGMIPTEGFHTEQGLSEVEISTYAKNVSKEIPAGRVGTPDDIADAILFLASEESDYIRGHDLVVDGGLTSVYAGKNGSE